MNTKVNLNSNTRLKVLSKSKNFQNYSYLVFSLVAIIVFAVFAIRPTVKNIIDLHTTIVQKQATLKKLQDKYASLNQAVANLNAINDDTKLKLYTLLPDSTNLPCYLDSLNQLGTTHNIAVLGLQVQQFDLQGISNCNPSTADLAQFKKNAVTQTSLSEVDYTLNTNGAYPDLLSALDAISISTRLTNIQTVTFTKAGDAPLIMNLEGKVFFYK